MKMTKHNLPLSKETNKFTCNTVENLGHIFLMKVESSCEQIIAGLNVESHLDSL